MPNLFEVAATIYDPQLVALFKWACGPAGKQATSPARPCITVEMTGQLQHRDIQFSDSIGHARVLAYKRTRVGVEDLHA
jgi:hypothetical protein